MIRPSFSSVADWLGRINKGRRGNLVEQMMRLMQKHAGKKYTRRAPAAATLRAPLFN